MRQLKRHWDNWRKEGGRLSPRLIFFVLVALLVVFGTDHQMVYADDGSGTVSSLFQHQKQESKQKADKSNGASTAKPSGPTFADTNLFFIFIKLVLALAIVLALIYLLYHFAAKRGGRFQASQLLKNLGGVSVGANRSVQLVQVGDSVLVVGVGDTVTIIKEITNPEIIARLTAPSKQTDTMEENVLKFLKQTADRAMKRSADDQPKMDEAWTKPLRDRLQNVKDERLRQVTDLLQEVKKDE